MALSFSNIADNSTAALVKADIDTAISSSEMDLAMVKLSDGSLRVVNAARDAGNQDLVVTVAKLGSGSSTGIKTMKEPKPGKYDSENKVAGTFGGQVVEGEYFTAAPVIGESDEQVDSTTCLSVASL